MVNEYRRVLIILLSFAFLFVFGCSSSEEAQISKNSNGFLEVKVGEVNFQGKLHEERLEIILSAPTGGWIALGINPTNMMQDANFIIGYVKDGKVNLRDDYGSWLTSHSSDVSKGGSSDYTILGGEERGNRTMLHFSIPLDSGEEFEEQFRADKENTILLAYGNRDDFSSVHRWKKKIMLQW